MYSPIFSASLLLCLNLAASPCATRLGYHKIGVLMNISLCLGWRFQTRTPVPPILNVTPACGERVSRRLLLDPYIARATSTNAAAPSSPP